MDPSRYDGSVNAVLKREQGDTTESVHGMIGAGNTQYHSPHRQHFNICQSTWIPTALNFSQVNDMGSLISFVSPKKTSISSQYNNVEYLAPLPRPETQKQRKGTVSVFVHCHAIDSAERLRTTGHAARTAERRAINKGSNNGQLPSLLPLSWSTGRENGKSRCQPCDLQGYQDVPVENKGSVFTWRSAPPMNARRS